MYKVKILDKLKEKMEGSQMYALSQNGTSIELHSDGEILRVEPWGENSLRVRSTVLGELQDTNYALLPREQADVEKEAKQVEISVEEHSAKLKNGKITAVIKLADTWRMTYDVLFYNQKGELLLREAGSGGALNRKSRHFKPILGGDYHLTVSFAANQNEKLYGMGQYQQDIMNL